MKTRLTLCTAAAVTIISSTYLSFSTSSNGAREFSDLELANIEALSDEEGGTSTSWTCWSKQKEGKGGYWRCGNPCQWIDDREADGPKGKCFKTDV